MKKENKITIFSTLAEDKLINSAGLVIGQQKGGPAMYIEQVLQKEKMPFDLQTGEEM